LYYLKEETFNFDKKHIFLIENTYENLNEFKLLNKLIQKYEYGGCFDIGHVNVWSKVHYLKWLEFFKKDKYYTNEKLHFHISHNNGLIDNHNNFENKNDIDIIKYNLFSFKNYNKTLEFQVIENELENNFKNYFYFNQ